MRASFLRSSLISKNRDRPHFSHLQSKPPAHFVRSPPCQGGDVVSYLSEGYTLRSWLTTHDHKRIAVLYMITITAFFFLGGAAAALMRLELATPAGDVVSATTYNKLFTIHGVIMVWFFLIPSIPSV